MSSSINSDYAIIWTVIDSPVYVSNRQITIKSSRKERDFQFLESRRLEYSPPAIGLEERLPVLPPVVASLMYLQTSTSNEFVEFDITSSAVDFLWSWGDGTFEVLDPSSPINHIYADPGSYIVGIAEDEDNPTQVTTVTAISSNVTQQVKNFILPDYTALIDIQFPNQIVDNFPSSSEIASQVVILDLGNNSLASLWSGFGTDINTVLAQLLLTNNSLTSFVFDSTVFPAITTLDVSDNSLSSSVNALSFNLMTTFYIDGNSINSLTIDMPLLLDMRCFDCELTAVSQAAILQHLVDNNLNNGNLSMAGNNASISDQDAIDNRDTLVSRGWTVDANVDENIGDFIAMYEYDGDLLDTTTNFDLTDSGGGGAIAFPTDATYGTVAEWETGGSQAIGMPSFLGASVGSVALWVKNINPGSIGNNIYLLNNNLFALRNRTSVDETILGFPNADGIGGGSVSFTTQGPSSGGSEQLWPNGVWSHIGVSYDGANFQLYQNGQPVTIASSGSGSFAFGFSFPAYGLNSVAQTFEHLRRKERVYDRVLSPSEFLEIYNTEV